MSDHQRPDPHGDHTSPHTHGGQGHSHDHGGDGPSDEGRLALVAALTGGFMLAEVAGGVISGSLALIADAGHMLMDFASLALAWFGSRLARKPADWRRTYGYDRFSVLAAFTNGIALFVIAAWIVVEAVNRLREPGEVLGGLMLAVAVAGLIVNLVAFQLLHGAEEKTLNLRAAILHVTGDLLGSVAAIVAALVIMFSGWTPIDPLLSVLVAQIILRSAWNVVAESGNILLEGSPPGFDNRQIAADLVSAVDGVADVHHVHVWSISDRRPMITLHARVGGTRAADDIAADIKRRLCDEHGVGHVTVEIEHNGCADRPGESGRRPTREQGDVAGHDLKI